MGYKVFTAGEEALASDVNTLLMSQTVARFATAAARSTQLTAPVLNQLSMRDDNKGVPETWSGSAWVPLGVCLQKSIGGNINAVITPTPLNQLLVSFTMPITGSLTLSGVAVFYGSAPGGSTVCSALVTAGAGSSPTPIWAPQFVGSPAPANTYNGTVPFIFKYPVVAAGTTVSLLVQYLTNAAQLQVAHHTGIISVVPLEFS
jgi:hypothetical protein